jgi:hypothetical protein
MAVRVGFEPTEPVKAQRFSRPPDSTALAPHRTSKLPDFQNTCKDGGSADLSAARRLSLLTPNRFTARVFSSRFVWAYRIVILISECPKKERDVTKKNQTLSMKVDYLPQALKALKNFPVKCARPLSSRLIIYCAYMSRHRRADLIRGGEHSQLEANLYRELLTIVRGGCILSGFLSPNSGFNIRAHGDRDAY